MSTITQNTYFFLHFFLYSYIYWYLSWIILAMRRVQNSISAPILTHDFIIFTPLLLLLFPDLSRTYTQDGVCLTESGLCQLQSLSATASRRRKPKPKLKLKIINQNSVAVLQAPLDPPSEHSRDEDMEDNRGTLTHLKDLLVFHFVM